MKKALVVLPDNPAIQTIVKFPFGGRVAVGQKTGHVYTDSQMGTGATLPIVYIAGVSWNITTPIVLPYNIGNPAVSPDESQILLQVACSNTSGVSNNPGVGKANDIYLGALQAAVNIPYWARLTNVGSTGGSVLHPKFSPDGKKIAWTQTSNGIQWELCIANNDGSNIQSFNPGYHGLYELGCFGPDSQTVYMAVTDQQDGGVAKNIYSFNYVTGAFVNLTNISGVWFEFPQVSPDGKRLAYVSSFNTGAPISREFYPLDLWVQNIDGSNPVRVTNYNLPPGSTYAFKVADIEWFANSEQLAALIYAMPQRAECVAIVQL